MKSTAACILSTLLLVIWTVGSPAASAEEPRSPAASDSPAFVLPLSALIRRVSGSPHETILVADQVRADVVTGDIGDGPVKYGVFLTILRNNGLVAVVSDDVISVVPDNYARSSALRTTRSLKEDIPADEWVSFTHRLEHASAPQLVPILRPLMPQPAHLAAFPEQNTLIIVDRFANVKRLVEIIRQLDKPGGRREQDPAE